MTSIRNAFINLGSVGRSALIAAALGASILAGQVPGVAVALLIVTMVTMAVFVVSAVRDYRADKPMSPTTAQLGFIWSVTLVGLHWSIGSDYPYGAAIWSFLAIMQVVITLFYGVPTLKHWQEKLARPAA